MPTLQELLPQAEIEKYKSQGFSENDIMQAVSELKQEAQQSQSQPQQNNESVLQQSYAQAVQRQQQDVRQFASNTLISGQGLNQNLVQWQLELDSILERVEHMLRGDMPKFVNGSMIFVSPDTSEQKIFTDFGVAEVMRILSMYLNRNTILSNYDEETINWKVFDFGNEVADLIFLKYEVMFATMSYDECKTKLGWQNIPWNMLSQEQLIFLEKEKRTQALEKRKLYPMIVRELVDVVHSSYLRALNGEERRSLHEARQVSQSETIMPGVQFNMNGQPVMKERSYLNPARYIKGKYA